MAGNAAEVLPELLRRGVDADVVTDQTSAHDPLAYLPIGVPVRDWHDYARRKPVTPEPRCSTTATRCAPRPSSAAASERSTIRNAGQVCVADGTALAAAKLERVLRNDPATGVLRHADAGYETPRHVAAQHGLTIPMGGPGRGRDHEHRRGVVLV